MRPRRRPGSWPWPSGPRTSTSPRPAPRPTGSSARRATVPTSSSARRRTSTARPSASLETEKSSLERKVEGLRAFEREYRGRLKTYLEGQLRELEGRATDAPASAGGQSSSATQGGAPQQAGQGAAPAQGGSPAAARSAPARRSAAATAAPQARRSSRRATSSTRGRPPGLAVRLSARIPLGDVPRSPHGVSSACRCATSPNAATGRPLAERGRVPAVHVSSSAGAQLPVAASRRNGSRAGGTGRVIRVPSADRPPRASTVASTERVVSPASTPAWVTITR